MRWPLRFLACTRKVPYRSDEAAQRALAKAQVRSPGVRFHIYRCQFCRARHLTSKDLTPEQRDVIREATRRAAKEGS